jgi:hypothetical protein
MAFQSKHLAGAWALFTAIATIPAARSYEVDNFTDRASLTGDALPILDARINQFLDRAILEANRASPERCNAVLLRQEFARWTGPDPVSLLEAWATFSEEVQQSHIGLDQSIYAGVTLTEAPALWFSGIGRSFKLAGHVVGTDKLGHFFMQGLFYFRRIKLENADINHVLRTEHGEDGLWGLTMTSVKSYADMAVNYQGYLFWSQLHQGEHPYAHCENETRWIKAREFTFADYVSDAWDEAINCSEFKPVLAARVERNLAKLGLHCPIDVRKCVELQKIEKSELWLSPACKGVNRQPSFIGP